jgi:hypothetical protein
MSTVSDPRWVILLEDGRYNLLGRHTEPTEADIMRAEGAMMAAGARGWLAIMDRSEFATGKPIFSMVKEIGKPATLFDDAVRTFGELRAAKAD